MEYSKFQKRIFEKLPVKTHKEVSDITIISILDSIINSANKKSFNILDVGCGGGQLLESFTKIPHIEIYGVDASAKACKIAMRRGYKAYICNVEKEKLPFDDDFFDIIVINDVLEHLIDPDNLLREAHRVLKGEGVLVISVPNISCPFSWFVQVFLDLPPVQSARYKSVHVRDYTLRILKIVLKYNGFKIKQVKGTYLYPFTNMISRHVANLFPRLSERLILICEKKEIPNLKLDDVYFNIKDLLSVDDCL